MLQHVPEVVEGAPCVLVVVEMMLHMLEVVIQVVVAWW